MSNENPNETQSERSILTYRLSPKSHGVVKKPKIEENDIIVKKEIKTRLEMKINGLKVTLEIVGEERLHPFRDWTDDIFHETEFEITVDTPLVSNRQYRIDEF